MNGIECKATVEILKFTVIDYSVISDLVGNHLINNVEIVLTTSNELILCKLRACFNYGSFFIIMYIPQDTT